MKVVICWGDIAGYTGACWRALAARSGIDLHVIALRAGVGNPNATFDDSVVAGVSCTLLDYEQWKDAALITRLVREQSPDVVILNGWFIPEFVQLAFQPSMRHIRFVMAMDTPLRHTWRQWFGRMKISRYLARMHRVIVAGERSWYLARYLGAEESKIRRGMDGIDYTAMFAANAARQALPGGWPRKFVFIGRYIHIKGIDVLLEAFAKYRSQTPDPWELTCCGKGAMTAAIDAAPGVKNMGFVQPSNLVNVLATHGAMVLPSRFDPWPLIVVEASAAGLPVIASNACGSAVEVVRGFHNGMMCTTGDADALARAMRWIHDRYDQLPEMGRRGTELASAYSAERWADRWQSMIEELAT